jgi:hypothetical protein
MTNKLISLTWEEFEEQFKPIKNTISKYSDNFMFETYGEELEFVQKQNPNHIWTESQIDYGFVTSEGYHFVNRMGYYITEVPWEDNVSYEIDLQLDTCTECLNPFSDDAWGCSEDGMEYVCNNCCGHEDCK